MTPLWILRVRHDAFRDICFLEDAVNWTFISFSSAAFSCTDVIFSLRRSVFASAESPYCKSVASNALKYFLMEYSIWPMRRMSLPLVKLFSRAHGLELSAINSDHHSHLYYFLAYLAFRAVYRGTLFPRGHVLWARAWSRYQSCFEALY